jgi:hypothetical protein
LRVWKTKDFDTQTGSGSELAHSKIDSAMAIDAAQSVLQAYKRTELHLIRHERRGAGDAGVLEIRVRIYREDVQRRIDNHHIASETRRPSPRYSRKGPPPDQAPHSRYFAEVRVRAGSELHPNIALLQE